MPAHACREVTTLISRSWCEPGGLRRAYGYLERFAREVEERAEPAPATPGLTVTLP